MLLSLFQLPDGFISLCGGECSRHPGFWTQKKHSVSGGGGGLEGGKSQRGLFRNQRSYRQGVGSRTEFFSCHYWQTFLPSFMGCLGSTREVLRALKGRVD